MGPLAHRRTRSRALQCLLNLGLGVYLWLFAPGRKPRASLPRSEYFFDYELLSFSSFDGWCTIVSFLLNYSHRVGLLLPSISSPKFPFLPMHSERRAVPLRGVLPVTAPGSLLLC